MKTKFTPLEHLYIDIATHYGKSHETYDIRILWVLEHMDELEDMYESAKDKATYMAAVIALRDTQEGRPSGFLCERDASASGIAILSTLTRCETGMFNTGILDNENRGNIYSKLNHELDGIAEAKDSKNALMTYMYGSNAEPMRVFAEKIEQFTQSAKKVAPRAYIARNLLIDDWQSFALDHSFDMPDGHHCFIRVWDTEDTRIQIPNLDNRTFTFRHTVNKGTEKGLSLAAKQHWLNVQ